MKELSDALEAAGFSSGHIALAITGIMIAGRVWHYLVTNGGLSGCWRAVIYGTNTPITKPDATTTNSNAGK